MKIGDEIFQVKAGTLCHLGDNLEQNPGLYKQKQKFLQKICKAT